MRQLDMTDVTLNELTKLAGRIAALLRKPQIKSNEALVAALDDLLGAIYALVSAREGGFKGKSGPSEFAPVLERANQVANGQVRTDGNWMAGFHFNSAAFRISAVFDRLPKALTCCPLSADSAYLEKTGKQWKKNHAHAIRKQVIDLKHRGGTYGARRANADLKTALSAVAQLLELAEVLT